jgi:hypothetical protein
LGTCVALELAFAISSITGAWFGVGWAIERAGVYVDTREASAEAAPASASTAEPIAAMPVVAVAAPAPELHVAVTTPRPPPSGTVFPAPDADLLAPIDAAPLQRVKLNRGGSSLSLRIEFSNGARAAFKPEQTHPQSDPRREIAAYRMDRLLGIGHVAPAKGASFTVAQLIAAADPSQRAQLAQRIDDEGTPRGRVLRGELQWWIPEIKDGQLAGRPLDDANGMAAWGRYLQADGPPIPDELRPLLAQIATVVLFDVVIDNADRWSGTNTKTSPDGATLYFMDNTLSFSPYTLGHKANLTPLHDISVFPRALVARLRALTLESVTAAVVRGDDAGLAPLLSQAELRAILARRDHVVTYIDQMIARYGDAAVLAFP